METITGPAENVFDYLDDLDIDLDTREVPATSPAAPATPSIGNAVIFDIETGPLPWADIEPYFEPPAAPGEFNETGVKVGNLKDPVKIAEKMAAARAAHAAEVAGHAAAIEAAKAEFIGRAALSPLTGRVLAIGYRYGNTDWVSSEENAGTNDERGILAEFWSRYEVERKDVISQRPFVGFNIFGFDLPFLIRRSWALGVDIPPDVLRDRRWSLLFVDLMQVWACGAYRDTINLDRLARFFGVGGKPEGIDGGMFAGLFSNPETREQAIEYLKNDLAMTAAVARKMGVC